MGSYQALAFDFGASTGRAVLGTLADGKLTCREVYRFDNTPVERDGTLYWDIDALLAGVREGMARAETFDSLAFDTWGVDFGLLDAEGRLLAPPVHYRDRRTAGLIPRVTDKVGTNRLYQLTGNQIMEINTLFQLVALQAQPALLRRAKTLLFMPDLLAYLISGAAVCEQSIASTSQLLDPAGKDWCHALLDELSLPADILPPVIPSGSITATLPGGAKVIAVAGHDTQSAVAAAPLQSDRAAFLSCGTWSLLGTELDRPVLTAESAALGLSNELGANGKVNYLKNIVGLWLLQESRRQWQREGKDYSFAALEQLATYAPPFRCFIDPDDTLFTSPGDMPGRVRAYCRETGQYVPQTVGEVVRCIYESLALKYRLALGQLEAVTDKRFDTLHIIGGGAQAALLCRMTASSCAIPVHAGPVEATALGNLLVQFVALGALPDIAAGRGLIAACEPVQLYQPEQPTAWQQAYTTFVHHLQKRS